MKNNAIDFIKFSNLDSILASEIKVRRTDDNDSTAFDFDYNRQKMASILVKHIPGELEDLKKDIDSMLDYYISKKRADIMRSVLFYSFKDIRRKK